MAQDTSKLTLDILKAQDLEDWQQHIGWVEVLEPALQRAKELLTKQLVDANLGKPPEGTTIEQIAGKLFGLQWITLEISRILKQGDYASKVLNP